MPSPDPQTLHFAWDRQLGLSEVQRILADPNHPEYLETAALILRELKPGQVWALLTPGDVLLLLPRLEHKLGRQRAFWHWLLAEWGKLGRV